MRSAFSQGYAAFVRWGPIQQGGIERMKRYVAALLVVLGVVGLVGVLAGGAGHAEDNGDNGDENASRAKCSEATLHGMYLFAFEGAEVNGNEQLPAALAGYDVYDGNGHVKTVNSVNFNGQITRNLHHGGKYSVKADCTGTYTSGPTEVLDLFIAPDGSKFTFVFVKPKSDVATGFEERATAKRVAQ
jgi:hypothetical protein